MAQQIGFGGVKSIQLLIKHGDCGIALIAQKPTYFSGHMAVVYEQMLHENRVVPGALALFARSPMSAADCARLRLLLK
jgi:hypothetical protein